MNINIVSCILFVSLLLVTPIHAQELNSSSHAQYTWQDRYTGETYGGSDSQTRQDNGWATAEYSSLRAQARTDFGINEVRLAGSLDGGTYLANTYTFASSRYDDLLTFQSAIATSGNVRYRLAIAGWQDYDNPWLEWGIEHDDVEFVRESFSFEGGDISGEFISDPFAVTFGTPLPISIWGSGEMWIFAFSPPNHAELSVRLIGFEIWDDLGAPLSDATILAASGADYLNLFGVTSAPEPGTLTLLALGLLVRKRRMRWRQPASYSSPMHRRV